MPTTCLRMARTRAGSTGAWLALALACAALVGAPGRTLAEGDPNTEKADMVCNMAKFVTWPDAMVTQNRGQLVVAVLGEDDLAVALATVLSSRTVNGKPVFVRFARRVQDVRGSQIVYIAGSELGHASDVIEALRGTPTLTLADIDGFTSRGGMVNFSGIPPNLRFEICRVRAEHEGLHISSRLLAISHVVVALP